MTKNNSDQHSASFRDPAGFVFTEGGTLYRQINQSYKKTYDEFMRSGLYDKLTEQQLLISHQEVAKRPLTAPAALIIQPTVVPCISYPYEWSFSQLKAAALATLTIEQTALEHQMTLKDASAYNIQFIGATPLLIDTLSFDHYIEGEPWISYRQFCQHFVAPLALMTHTDIRLNHLLIHYLDGLPLDLAAKLLPAKTRLHPGLLAHLHLHAKAQDSYAHKKVVGSGPKFSRQARLGLIQSLIATIKSLELPSIKTEWGNYYESTNYSAKAFAHKKAILEQFVKQITPKKLCDIGANTSLFSQIASSQNIQTLAIDIDPIAVDRAYREIVATKQTTILPLVIDITNPSPGIGWDNTERYSFWDRLNVDTMSALAIIHHLTISNNLPFTHTARTFAKHAEHLIIEFVPKSDSQVQRLLANRRNQFDDYTQEAFEQAFGNYFTIQQKEGVKESERTLYLMRRKK